MNIKAIKLFLLAILCTVAFASCDDDEKTKTDDETYVYYNLQVVPSEPSANGSAITKDMQWKTGDQVAALNLLHGRNVVKMTYDGSKFSGSMPSLSSAGTVGYFYPTHVVNQTTSDTTTVRVNFQIQDGVTVEPYLAGEETPIITGSTADSELNMRCVNAYANIQMMYNGAPVNDMVHIEISAYKGTLYNKGDYELKTLKYSTLKQGNISVLNSSLNGVARIMMIPTEGVALAVTAIAADGRAYIGRMDKAIAIEAGGEYTIRIDAALEEGTASVGDYFYSDYTRSAEYDETKTLVGVVYALSDTEGGDINPSLSSSNHGRVVSVTDYGKVAWVFSKDFMFDVPRITNYSNADGSNAQGFLPMNAIDGTYSADADTRIEAALDALGRIKSWPKSGALSDFDGRHNTECSDTAVNHMPAPFYASNFDKGGLTGWYLPSAGEMALISAQCSSGLMDDKEGFVPLRNFTYWTSTEQSAEMVWAVQVFNGRVVANYKTSLYMVRPVLQF